MSMTDLEARINRMETMMQELLSTLTTSRAEVERTEHMQTMLQELLIRHQPGSGPATGAAREQSHPRSAAGW
jgi:uncharacterized coiled-coil protein SlyX